MYTYATTVLAVLVDRFQRTIIGDHMAVRKAEDVQRHGLRGDDEILQFHRPSDLSRFVIFGLWRHDVMLVAPALALPFAYFNQVTLAFFLSDGHVRWANVQGLIGTRDIRYVRSGNRVRRISPKGRHGFHLVGSFVCRGWCAIVHSCAAVCRPWAARWEVFGMFS